MIENFTDILLVEDNRNDAELIMMALRGNNIANSIILVDDGEKALDYLFGTGPYKERKTYLRPKMILLDLKLPKVDGFEVLRRIRTDERTRTIPVIVLTSSKEEQDMIESYNLGVNSYVVKPVNFENFTKIVRDLGFYWLVINQPVPIN